MPLDVGNLRTKSTLVDVYAILGNRELKGQLNVAYKLNGAGIEDTLELQEAQEDMTASESALASIELLMMNIVSWDLEDGGQPVPPTLEGVREANVPMMVLNDVAEAITKSRKAGEARGKSSKK